MKIAGAKSIFSAQGGRLSLSGNKEVDVRSGTALGSLNMEMTFKNCKRWSCWSRSTIRCSQTIYELYLSR